MTVTFIRHGESQANAGEPCHDFALIEITPQGRRQALALAETWDEAPDLIIHSPFLRTHQTAAPTLERFPHVEVQVWPVHEFTNLEPSRWNGSLPAEREPHIDRYWNDCNPTFCDGPGAESFATFMDRARAALHRLTTLPPDSRVLVFSHGFFMNAIRSLIIDPDLDDSARMQAFVPAFNQRPIRNTERLDLQWDGRRWTFVEAPVTTVASR